MDQIRIASDCNLAQKTFESVVRRADAAGDRDTADRFRDHAGKLAANCELCELNSWCRGSTWCRRRVFEGILAKRRIAS